MSIFLFVLTYKYEYVIIVVTLPMGTIPKNGGKMSNKREVAKKILDLIGGTDNIKSIEHCATRLRLSLVDETIAKDNEDKLSEIEMVKGHFYSVGQFQIILGAGTVNEVYEEMIKLGSCEGNVKDDVYKDLSPIQKASRILGDIFIPIIPAIVAAGMFMGIANTLKFMGLIEDGSNLSMFISIVTDTAFVFLPALIAWSSAKKFGGNPVLGIVLGLMLVSPVLPNAWSAAGGFGDVEPLVFSFGFFSVNVVGMQGQVLTPLVLGYIIAKLEKLFRKYTPEAIDIIVVPTLAIVVSLALGLFILGPILFAIEHSLTNVVYHALQLPLGIGQMVLGFFSPIIVMTGLHHAFGPLELLMISEYGTTPLNAAISSANMAMAGAAFGCALKLMSGKSKSLSYSSSLTAGFGITEPALFGVILRTGRVLLMGMIGGAVGGLLSGLFNLGATGTGVTGIPGIMLYIGTGQELQYIIAMVASFSVAMILTMKFGQFDKKM